MSQIKVARYSGVKYEFVDGYARVPVLEGEFDQAHFAHCALQPGCSITPEVYSVTEHNQLFIFTKGKGYVTTPRQAWNIREPGVFVPEFDAERFTITCSADSKQPLEFLHIITELSDYDKTCLVESRMVLPRFRGISEGWTYDEDFKDNSVTTSMMLLEHRNLGRLSMGCVKGNGPIEATCPSPPPDSGTEARWRPAGSATTSGLKCASTVIPARSSKPIHIDSKA